MDEPPRLVPVEKRESVLRTLAGGLETVRDTPLLRRLCLITLVAAFASMSAHHLWQPRLQSLSEHGIWVMGWIWAFLNLANVAGGALVARLDGRLARDRTLRLVALWRGATLAVAALATHFYPAVIAFILWEAGFGVSEPLFQAWMNENVGSERRATVLSVRAMSFTLGAAGGLLCLGLVARSAGIATAWLCSAAILTATGAGYIGINRLRGGSVSQPQAQAARALPLPLPLP
jgi:predicted MFS family arabinose efflux permease